MDVIALKAFAKVKAAKAGSTIGLSWKELYEFMKHGHVSPFIHNRGKERGEGFSQKTYLSTKNNFFAPGFGTIHINRNEDGTLTCVEGNSRSRGFTDGADEGKIVIGNQEGTASVAVYNLDSEGMLKLYRTLNTTDPHRSAQFLSTPEFYLCRLMREICPGYMVLTDSQRINFANIVVGYVLYVEAKKEDPTERFGQSFYRSGAQAVRIEMRKIEAEAVELVAKIRQQADNIRAAFAYSLKIKGGIVSALQSRAAEDGVSSFRAEAINLMAVKLGKHLGPMIFFMGDFLGERRLKDVSTNSIAKKISEDPERFFEWFVSLSSNTPKTDNIYDVLIGGKIKNSAKKAKRNLLKVRAPAQHVPSV